MSTRIKMAPELAPEYFGVALGRLYRKLVDGTFKPITSLNGQRLVTMHEKERIHGPELAWCLYYGNWPKYKIVQLDGDPFNLAKENLFAARLRSLRYSITERRGMSYHPLSHLPFSNTLACREDWLVMAREVYRVDMANVMREEALDRERRQASDVVLPVRPKRVGRPENFAAKDRPPRPAPAEGMVWHYYKKEWISIPTPVHVSDDYRRRAAAWLAGCRKFVYEPDYAEVWAYLPTGEVWHPTGQV